MQNKYLIPFLTCSALALSILPAWGQSNTTSSITFTCEKNQDVPITVAQNNVGTTQNIFHWKKEALPVSTNPQLFCEEVAQKLNNYAAEGHDLSLIRLTANEQAGLPMICLTEQYGICDVVLLILPITEQPINTANNTVKAILDREILEHIIPCPRCNQLSPVRFNLFQGFHNQQ